MQILYLPFLCDYEICSLLLMEIQGLRIFENRVLRNVFDSK